MFTRKVAAVVLPVTVAAAGLVVLAQAHRPMSAVMRHISAHDVPIASRRAPLPISRTPLDAQRSFGAPITYHNLTLLPVYDANARSTDAYLTLDEGLKAKTVQESGEGGTVNTLYVTNTSRKPLYLMGGEVVLGGQQDRAISRDILVAAGKKRVPITVFCVEHGRWTGHEDFKQSAQSVASADIRLGAQDGEFAAEQQVAIAHAAPAAAMGGTPTSGGPVNGYGTVGTPSLLARQAVNATVPVRTGLPASVENVGRPNVPHVAALVAEPVDTAAAVSASAEVGKAQQQVWDKVSAKNAAFKTASDTGTYRNVLNMSMGDASKNAPAYVNALANRLGQDPHLVGVVAAVNGSVVTTDIFSDPILFQKLWPKLLRSYAADAVEKGNDGKPQAIAITPAQVNEFYTGAVSGKSQEENKTESGSNTRLESSQATTFRLVPTENRAIEKGAVGSPSQAKALHETVLHK